MRNRAYSFLTLKSVDDEQRVIEGIASTPEPDRLGDIVEPEGAVFKLPIPLLWQHKSDSPIGHVTAAKVTKDGIEIRAELVRVDEPGTLRDTLERAWQSIKTGLVRGLSIGFNPIEAAEIKGTWSFRFTKWEWLELSAVTIPANASATMTNIKLYDTGSTRPGASGIRLDTNTKREGSDMTITERIRQAEATRAARVARMNTLLDGADSSGSTLDPAAAEEYDTIRDEVAELDKHLVRLREAETVNKASIVPVQANDTQSAARSRGPQQITVRTSPAEKGITYARYAMALLNAKGSRLEAEQYAKGRWPDDDQVVALIKAPAVAGTTTSSTWAGPLVPTTAVNDFLELLRPKTFLGSVPGLRRVPFYTSIPVQTAGGTYGWVGQGAPKPVTALAFTTATLGLAKAAGIIVLTEELVKSSEPSAEAVVRDDMVAGIAQFLNTQFVDPAVAAVVNVSPASITNAVTGTAASGTTLADARSDLITLIGTLAGDGYPVNELVLMMSESNALALSALANEVGAPAFPSLGIGGGTIYGIPVVTSNVVGTQIIAAHTPSILFADDGQTVIDLSREASIQMDTAPMNPADATTVLVSFWQNNLVGLRAERWINWNKARADAVDRITGAAYGT